MYDKLLKITKVIRSIEKYCLVTVISFMVLLSVLQIFLRMFFKAVTWFDSFLSYSVLWSAMIAAGVVTYESNHIKIDLIGRFTKGKLKEIVNGVVAFFGGLTSITLALIFTVYVVVIEYFSKAGSQGPASYKWLYLSILPIGFFIISVRMLNRMIICGYNLLGKRKLGLINSIFSVIISAVILMSSVLLIHDENSISNIVMYFGGANVLLMIAIVSGMVILIGITGVFGAITQSKPRITYYLSSAAGLYHLILFVYFMLRLIHINVLSKVNNEIVVFNEAAVNLLYIIPIMLFFFFHFSFTYPVANYLKEFYPVSDSVDDKGAD